jgi:hypothetical protein
MSSVRETAYSFYTQTTRGMRAAWTKIVLNCVALSVALFLFMGNYIVNSGYIIYRDLSWPYTSGLIFNSWSLFDPNLINVNVGQADSTGFFRVILTWPLALLATLGLSSADIEKVFFIGIFCLVYVVLYLTTLTIDKIAGRRPPELLRIFLLLIMASNFYVMQSITWYPIWLGYALLTLLAARLFSWLTTGDRRDLWLATIAWIVVSVLDLRFVIWASTLFIVIVVVVIVTTPSQFSQQMKKTFLALLAYSFVILPFYLSQYVLNNVSASVNTSTLVASAAGYFQNAPSIINAIRLDGYWWSTVDYISPSPGLSGVWTLATFAVPIVLGLAVILRKRGTIAFAVLGLVGVDLSVGTNSPINAWLFSLASHLGGLGNLILIPFLPTYYSLIVLACGYSLCFYYVCLCIFPVNHRTITRYLRFSLVIILIASQLFVCWQFYNGSLSPSGTIGVGSVVTEPVGVLQPASPPSSVLQAYTWLEGQPGLFNTVWMPGTFGYAYTWNSKSSPFDEYYSPPKPFLYFPINSADKNFTLDLQTYHVKYVIVQNDTEPVTTSVFYGFANVSQIRNFLVSNGLILVENYSNSVWVYLNPDAPDYVSCTTQSTSTNDTSEPVSWQDVTPYYWIVNVNGNGQICNLNMVLKSDSGWIAVGAGLSLYHSQDNTAGLLQFSVPANGSYSIIYLPYIFALPCLVLLLASIAVFLILLAGKRSASWSFKALFPIQFAFYSALIFATIVLPDSAVLAVSATLLVVLIATRILVSRGNGIELP